MNVGEFLAAHRRSNPFSVAVDTTFDHDSSGNWLSVNTLADFSDPWSLHDAAGANPERILIPHEGLYFYSANVVFPANATGQRGVRIRNSAGTTVNIAFSDAAAADVTALVVTGLTVVTGTFLDVQAFQSSTGTLSNLQTIFQVAMIQ